jgi:anti-sigma regulatory factor (Ser/Thr protein kinase)
MNRRPTDIPTARYPPATVDLCGLGNLRRTLISLARAHGVQQHVTDRLVLAVNEIASNAIIHGGGSGHLELWVEAGYLHCQVTDHGPGMPAGYEIPQWQSASATSGRGLWLAAQFCHLEIRTGAQGTTVDLSVRIPDSWGGMTTIFATGMDQES